MMDLISVNSNWLSFNDSVLGVVDERGNPDIPAYTLRFRFDPSYTETPPLPLNYIRPLYPTGGTLGSWTKVQGVEENLWDYTFEDSDWASLFFKVETGRDDVTYRTGSWDIWNIDCEIVDSGDLTGITGFESTFNAFENLLTVNIPSRITRSSGNTEPPFWKKTKLTTVHLGSVLGCPGSFFSGCTKLESVTIDFFNNRKNDGLDAGGMFGNCYKLTSINFTFIQSPTNCSGMFAGCKALTQPPIFDTSAVTTMYSMFEDCESLTSTPLYDMRSCRDTGYMFRDCTSLEIAPNLDTSNVTDMRAMFLECSNLKQVPLYNTSKAKNMGSMFYNCRKVEHGAVALYNQAVSQTGDEIVTVFAYCFMNCGIDTVSGAAENACIDPTWGGTASGDPIQYVTVDLPWTYSGIVPQSNGYADARLGFALPSGHKRLTYGNPYLLQDNHYYVPTGGFTFGYSSTVRNSSDALTSYRFWTASGSAAVSSYSGTSSTNGDTVIVFKRRLSSLDMSGLMDEMINHITLHDWPLGRIYSGGNT